MKLHPCQIIFILSIAFTSTFCIASNTKSLGTTPSPRTINYDWMSLDNWNKAYADDIAVAHQGGVDLLFVGDSITGGWDQEIWIKNFSAYHPANFGIGGDHTGNVLWRLENGHANALKPKAVILLIGVNNFGNLHETPAQVFSGIKAVVKKLQKIYPAAKILVNGILPFEESAQSEKRAMVIKTNKMIATLNDNKHIFVRDYSAHFLQSDGTISKEVMKDFLHPTPKGYQIWVDAMLPDIQTLMQ